MTDRLVTEAFDAIRADSRVPWPSFPNEAAYQRATDATAALRWTLAVMPSHQLEPVAQYLAGLLAKEPVQSGAMWEPHRIAIGLFLLALRELARHEDAPPDPTLTPPWYLTDEL